MNSLMVFGILVLFLGVLVAIRMNVLPWIGHSDFFVNVILSDELELLISNLHLLYKCLVDEDGYIVFF